MLFRSEVSSLTAARRLTLVKQPGGAVQAAFAPRSEASGYNFYQGDISAFYNHGDAPLMCNAAVTAAGADTMILSFTPGPGDHYYYVTAWNGDPLDGREGTAGSSSTGPRPSEQNTCPPSTDL